MTEIDNPVRMCRRVLVASMAGLVLLSGCHIILGLTGAPDDPVTQQRALTPDGGVAGASGGRGPGNAGTAPAAVAEVRPQDPCTTYCDTIARVCTGGLQQYGNGTDCQSLCPELQRREDNGLLCRMSALTEYRDTGCASAGPVGMTARLDVPSCEEDACELYCELMSGACADTELGQPDEPNAAGSTTADREDCLAVCASVPVSPDYSVSPRIPAGNNMNCRIHHINLALGAPPASTQRFDHCEHAAGRQGLFALRTIPCQDRAPADDNSAEDN